MAGMEWGVDADPNPEPGTFLVEWQSGEGKRSASTCLPPPEQDLLTPMLSQIGRAAQRRSRSMS